MCQNCFTAIDAVAVNSAIVFAAASGGTGFVKQRLGLDPGAKERRYLRTAAMMQELGLDVATVLGPPPARRTPEQTEPAPQAPDAHDRRATPVGASDVPATTSRR